MKENHCSSYAILYHIYRVSLSFTTTLKFRLNFYYIFFLLGTMLFFSDFKDFYSR